MLLAVTRKVSPKIGHCELTHIARSPIDAGVAREQHRRYEECLSELGCRIISLPEEPDLPDSVFVEDTAVVLDEVAVIARPGAASRRPETRSIAEALKPYRELTFIEPPGTIDGGDVLRIGRTLFVGMSSRSNEAGIGQLSRVAVPLGYAVKRVRVSGCLHLKSAVTLVADDAILVNQSWVDKDVFGRMRCIDVDESEPYGANALLVGKTVVYPAAHPETRIRLEINKLPVRTVDVSELTKAEGAVTCCSLIFRV